MTSHRKLGRLVFAVVLVALGCAACVLFLFSRGGKDRPVLDPKRIGPAASDAPPAIGIHAYSNRIPASDPEAPADVHAAGLTIVVSFEEGAPVPGASVHGLRGGVLVSRGRTGEDGILTVDDAAAGDEEVIVSAGGFVTCAVELPEERPALVEVVLRREGNVFGRVVLEDGTRVGPGVQVMAWQEADHPGRELVRRARRGDPRAIWGVTDSAGAFHLEGLDPDRMYFAVAGGKGYASPVRKKMSFFRSGQDLVLVVQRAYAAWLRLREEGGGPLRTSPLLYGRRFGTVRPMDLEIDRASGSTVHAMLAIDPMPDMASTLSDRFFVFTSGRNSESLGPIEFELDYPGYEPRRASFHVPAFDGRDPAEIILELSPSAESWGSLEVVFLSELSGYARVEEAEPLGIVRLFDEQGMPSEYAVRDGFPTNVVIEGLPAGYYDWEFRTLEGSFHAPHQGRGREHITPSGGRIEIDVAELGGVELDVRRRDGTRYRGAAWIACEGTAGYQLPSRGFSGPPYVLGGLIPGLYEIWIDQPRLLDRSRETARAAGVSLVVESSQVSRATVQLGE